MMEDTILEVDNLRTSFATDAGSVQSVRGITFHVGKGESLGIVGESGCGKSVTMLPGRRTPCSLTVRICLKSLPGK